MTGHAHVPVAALAGKRELCTIESEVVEDNRCVRGPMCVVIVSLSGARDTGELRALLACPASWNDGNGNTNVTGPPMLCTPPTNWLSPSRSWKSMGSSEGSTFIVFRGCGCEARNA